MMFSTKTFHFLFALIFILALNGNIYAQTPYAFKYQAVVRNDNGLPIANKNLDVKISIQNGDAIIAYSEVHRVKTSALGIISFNVGGASDTNVISGTMQDIDWKSDNYFLRIDIADSGSDIYKTIGIAQLLSVPYALFAKESGNTFSGNYNDLTDQPDLDGFITSEMDPVFSASPASAISASDTVRWNAKSDFSGEYTDLIGFPDLSDTSDYLKTEIDPVFEASLASKITEDDTTRWGLSSGGGSENFWVPFNKNVSYQNGLINLWTDSSTTNGIFNVENSITQFGLLLNQNSGLTKEYGLYSTVTADGTNDTNIAILGNVTTQGGAYYGVVGQALSTNPAERGFNYGVKGIAGQGFNGYNYGVYGELFGWDNGAAIYGTTSWDEGSHLQVLDGRWAGYFEGSLFAKGPIGIGNSNLEYTYSSLVINRNTTGDDETAGIKIRLIPTADLSIGEEINCYLGTPNSQYTTYGLKVKVGNSSSGKNYGVYSQLDGDNDGASIIGTVGSQVPGVINGKFAGYFMGNVHCQDSVGIGTDNPQRKLHVSDAMRLELTTTPLDATVGDMYMDAADSTLKVYDGTMWRELW